MNQKLNIVLLALLLVLIMCSCTAGKGVTYHGGKGCGCPPVKL